MKVRFLICFVFSLNLTGIARVLKEPAANYPDSLLTILQSETNDSVRAVLYLNLCNYFFGIRPDTALCFAINAVEFAERSNIQRLKAKTLRSAGILYNELGDHLQAREIFNKTFGIYKVLRDTTGMASSLGNIGNSYFFMGKSNDAYTYYQQALHLFTIINHKKGIALCQATLGNILLKEEEYTLARDHYNQAYKVFQQLGDSETTAITLMNIGITLRHDNMLEEAGNNFKKAKDVFRELKSRKNEAQCLANLARIDMKLKHFNKAIEKDQLALELLNQTEAKHEIALTLNDLAIAYDSLKTINKALDFYLQALNVYEEINPWAVLNKEINENIARCFIMLGNTKKASEHLLTALRIQDSLISQGKKQNMAEVVAKYELNKKEQEIKIRDQRLVSQETVIKKSRLISYLTGLVSLLLLGWILLAYNRYRLKQKTNKILEGQTKELKDALDQLKASEKSLQELNSSKDAFFSIIAHDLRGPFNAFINLSEILSQKLKDFTPEKIAELLNDMHQSATNLFDLLENLLEWARLQNNTVSFNPKYLPVTPTLNKELELLKIHIRNKEIRMKVSLNEKSYVFVDNNMLGSSFRNILWNAIKFTPRGGTILVKTSESDRFCAISVQDTGVGMSDRVIEHLFKIEHRQSSLGTEHELGTGLGLVICKLFIEKNGGTIQVESKLGKGSTFTFTVPKS